MRTKGKRVSYQERQLIERSLKEGMKVKDLAEKMGLSMTTVYGEIRRCPGEYNADEAQRTLR